MLGTGYQRLASGIRRAAASSALGFTQCTKCAVVPRSWVNSRDKLCVNRLPVVLLTLDGPPVTLSSPSSHGEAWPPDGAKWPSSGEARPEEGP